MREPTLEAIALCLILPFGTARADSHSLPNLTPQNPSTAPLLRKINSTSATMIPMSFCGRVPADQEMDVDVPPFDWGVANDQRAAVEQAFSVALLNASSNNAPLALETVQSMSESGTRIFRNWPGRPVRVRVIKVTAANPKLANEYDNTPGCYIPTALIGSVRLDPKALTIRVDAGGQITERIENDNDFTR